MHVQTLQQPTSNTGTCFYSLDTLPCLIQQSFAVYHLWDFLKIKFYFQIFTKVNCFTVFKYLACYSETQSALGKFVLLQEQVACISLTFWNTPCTRGSQPGYCKILSRASQGAAQHQYYQACHGARGSCYFKEKAKLAVGSQLHYNKQPKGSPQAGQE